MWFTFNINASEFLETHSRKEFEIKSTGSWKSESDIVLVNKTRRIKCDDYENNI